LLPMVTYEKYAYFQSCTHQAEEISQTDPWHTHTTFTHLRWVWGCEPVSTVVMTCCHMLMTLSSLSSRSLLVN
jgi:hypothetical protein